MINVTGEAIKEGLTAALRKRRAWEEPPALCFVNLEDGEVVVSDFSIFNRWPPEPTFALPHIADTMNELGEMVSKFAGGVPDNLVGISFRCEAWSLAYSKKEDAELPHQRRMRELRLLHAHPLRVEIRLITAAFSGGRIFMASQERGSEEIEVHEANEQIEGIVPESLARMLTGLTMGASDA